MAALKEVRLLTVIGIFGSRQEFINTRQRKNTAGTEAAARSEFVEFSPALCIKNSEFIEATAISERLMNYRRLGSSDLLVSEIALGSWLTYSGGVDAVTSKACVHKALGLGINFIDTANIYGRGAAETLLGEALAGVPRDKYVLATKLYFPMTDTDRGLSRAQVLKQIDASLARLKTDYVDLYQCHRFDRETPLEETMQALTEVVQAGKARYIGFSEWPAEGIRAALGIPGAARFISSQPQYSMFWRKPEAEIIPLCETQGISQIVWSPLAQGVLTGKYKPGQTPAPGTRATSREMGGFLSKALLERETLEAVQKAQALAASAGLSMAQFALAWVLRLDNVASAIIGATKPEQVEENAAASGRQIDPAFFEEAERLLDRVGAR
jgi:aryl-alcohol dehydrogenase-like predicted oxidoreductase